MREDKQQFENFMKKEKEKLRVKMQTDREDSQREKEQMKRSQQKLEVEVEQFEQQCKEGETKMQTQQSDLQLEKRILVGTKKRCTAENKALLERERGVRKKEEKVEKANLKSWKREEKLDLEKLIFSKEAESQTKRCQKENEILTVREQDQQQKDKILKKDEEMISKEKDCIRDHNQHLLSREEYVHRIG